MDLDPPDHAQPLEQSRRPGSANGQKVSIGPASGPSTASSSSLSHATLTPFGHGSRGRPYSGDDPFSSSATTSTSTSSLSNTGQSGSLRRDYKQSYGDRFIPTRDLGADLGTAYRLLPSRSCFDLRKTNSSSGFGMGDKSASSSSLSAGSSLGGHGSGPWTPRRGKRRASAGAGVEASAEDSTKIFANLLQSEMFGGVRVSPSPTRSRTLTSDGIVSASPAALGSGSSGTPSRQRMYTAGGTPIRAQTVPGTPTKMLSTNLLPTTPTNGRSSGAGSGGAMGGLSGSRGLGGGSGSSHGNLFTFQSPSRSSSHGQGLGDGKFDGGLSAYDSPYNDAYSLSPIKFSSQAILQSPRKQTRPISKTPYKVLDAPELADDFYLNLVDWSGTNHLAVGLGATVYLWSGATHAVTKLCDQSEQSDLVTSVGWVEKGRHLAVGTNKGLVQIWDAESSQLIRTMKGHTQRAGCLAWNDHILSSGSRDKTILHRDVRAPTHHIARLEGGHRQEVCGLKWNSSLHQLASGGNDNKLLVWDRLNHSGPLWRFDDHTAAVKAISWNPHQQGILASGGGTQDRKIRFWNTLTGQLLNDIDTGSQVCNLAFSKNSNEIVSTHGYSQNQIAIWKYPSLVPVATLTGHASRVLYLALSPDGQSIVTGAGDETLRFWNVFGKAKDRSGLLSGHQVDSSDSLHAFGGTIR